MLGTLSGASDSNAPVLLEQSVEGMVLLTWYIRWYLAMPKLSAMMITMVATPANIDNPTTCNRGSKRGLQRGRNFPKRKAFSRRSQTDHISTHKTFLKMRVTKNLV
jgi:hypothetical protein